MTLRQAQATWDKTPSYASAIAYLVAASKAFSEGDLGRDDYEAAFTEVLEWLKERGQ